MKKCIKLILFISVISWIIVTVFSCKKEETVDYLAAYKKPDKNIMEIIGRKEESLTLFKKNRINLKNGYPFYIIRDEAPLLLSNPGGNHTFPPEFIMLKFGDIVFPADHISEDNYFFYVKTINGEYGWMYSGYGISVNYEEDTELYFFGPGDSYYLTQYINNKGEMDKSHLIVLAKNVIPMLLDNYKTTGWFYPSDYNLALILAKQCVAMAENKDTYFFSATAYDWRMNEMIISYNLLADSYHRLKFFDKAEEVQTKLLRPIYFWKRADNTMIGGLNSVVKLEMIYLDRLKYEKFGTLEYKKIQNKLVETILIVGDNYNEFTVIDKQWHLTAAEWVLDILKNSVSRNEFYDFATKIKRKTTSEGYVDMVNLYVAIEMYKEGKHVEALKILTGTKPKHNFKSTLRINDWLSANKVIPDSIVYQYRF